MDNARDLATNGFCFSQMIGTFSFDYLLLCHEEPAKGKKCP